VIVVAGQHQIHLPRLTGLNVVRPRAGALRALHIDPAAAPGVGWHPSGGNSQDGAGNDHLNLAIGHKETVQGDGPRRQEPGSKVTAPAGRDRPARHLTCLLQVAAFRYSR